MEWTKIEDAEPVTSGHSYLIALDDGTIHFATYIATDTPNGGMWFADMGHGKHRISRNDFEYWLAIPPIPTNQ